MAEVLEYNLVPEVLTDLPFCHPLASLTGRSMTSEGICSFELAGNTALTDRDGVVSFDELAFTKALPGAYLLNFYTDNARANVTLWFTVQASISALLPADDAPSGRFEGTHPAFSGTVAPMPLAQSSTPPAVVALSLAGNRTTYPISPLIVTAFALDPSVDLGGRLASTTLLAPDPERARRANPLVVLGGATAVADENGVARFPNLTIAGPMPPRVLLGPRVFQWAGGGAVEVTRNRTVPGFDRPDLVLAFTCQGFVLVWSEVMATSADTASGELYRSAFRTIASATLPTPVMVTAAADPRAVAQFEDEVVEGKPFSISLALPPSVKQAAGRGELSGTFLVVRAVALRSALEAAGGLPLAPLASDTFDHGSAAESLWWLGGVPSNLKQFERRATAPVDGSDRITFFGEFSTHGAVGEYEVRALSCISMQLSSRGARYR